jgi:dUTPase
MSLEYPKFELVSNYDDINLLPKRATKDSAGYDFVVAEDTIV